MESWERIQFVMDREGMNKNSFSRAIGISNNVTITRIINEHRSPSRATCEKIVSTYPKYNLRWLLTGEGNMLNNDLNNNEETQTSKTQTYIGEEIPPNSGQPYKNFTKGVPYYNVDFIGGFDLILNDQTRVPEYLIDFEKYNEATCWCNITGHSMEPEISHGDILALKEIVDWKEFLPFGEVYGIVTKEHRTIKRVTASEKEDNFLLIPTNKSPEYKAQNIPIKIILKVFKVLGCMKRL
ncbi:LexA family transcriptional regulator [uncultured Bacteroides sp.]|uniref:LexA family transcriptional regulator n=1 Tax=uncultured Bacteroides sp. TaxID=162156 RepID=UPI002AAAA368|nr:LexA family transcriptional regulator [uncultured Bacteroides sp.]